MSTLLSLIGESERFRLKPKNLPPTDDITENSLTSYLDDYGKTGIQDYSQDVNLESPSVSDVGIIALRDSKDYNAFPQDTYQEFDNSPIDVSVIDMPEIDEISEDIYLSNVIYNKYSNLEYVPYEVQLAAGVQNSQENYGEYISEVLQNLEIRGNTLADIFIGQWNLDDSPIGVIGGQALNVALNTQLNDGLSRKVVGLLNNSVFSLLDGGELIRENYSITVPKTKIGKTAEFIAKLGSLESATSYLPEDVFDFHRTKVVSNGKVSYRGAELSYTEQINLLLQYTGKGQEKQLLNLMDMNLYHPKIEGRTKTLYDKSYVGYSHFNVGSLDISAFVVSEEEGVKTQAGYYEPYGVISRHRNDNNNPDVKKQIFSDGFWFMWTEDISDKNSIGWVKRHTTDTTQSTNPFDSKSILFKTQELVNSEFLAFLDLSKKSFTEIIDGEARLISRGDGTTASADAFDEITGEILQTKGDYFRVWTKERGYNKLNRALRHRGLDNGDKRSVLNDNGIPNYAPTLREATGRNGLANDAVIKRYMLSLENLAWNDHMDDLPECEQGPGDILTGTRGRIMWFPPYNLDFSETVSPSWNPHDFIGRGEKIYTYNNTERTGSLSFTIPVDYPDILQTLVGEKTQYWERYFKGDKAIEKDAIKEYKAKKNISQKELDELDKIKKPVEPRMKKVTKVLVTENKVAKIKSKEVKEKVDQGKFGALVLSTYFTNNVYEVPRSHLKVNLENISSDAVVDTSINIKEMEFKNVGYEDGGEADGFKTIDNYTINTSNGLEYKDKTGKIVNTIGRTKQATYEKGSIQKGLQRSVGGCPDISNEGWQDTTNFGLNVPFYFEWQVRFYDALKDKTKVEINFIGNASLPGAANSLTNTILARDRAKNTKDWFEKNVKPLLEKQGLKIEYIFKVDSKADEEDQQKGTSGLIEATNTNSGSGTYCGKCSRPHLEPCKKSRRVDIFIKDLSDEVPVPEVPEEPEYETITSTQTIEEYVPDDSQDNIDPNGDSSPDIDEGLLNKLVYTECDYFKYLETYDPIAYQTISEKIKYFTPAFHSMTPQGFNSRLTFLHQCTRQGESIGMDGVDNIRNLAFGRPPVCILRIGDFFHVKVLITNMTIDYKAANSIAWDLNPEGIGIQPMFANVTLSITILGGMSMTAPINRLQNALSFNFYANTEMYDARSDSAVFEAKFDEAGNLDSNKTYGAAKSGKIIDGIKLSSIFKYTEAEKAQQLAKIRQDSRLALENSTTVPTEKIENLGTVGSLLEYKKRAGLPLTSQEKTDLKVEETVVDKFTLNSNDITKIKAMQGIMGSNLKTQNSLLNLQAQGLLEKPNNTQIPLLYQQTVSQYINTVYLPSEVTPEIEKTAAEEYLSAFRDVWVNQKTGKFIKY